jgi:superfamily II DNA or RNA helicase
MRLREYQSKTIQNIKSEFIKGHNRIVICAPTGAGKTIIFSEITRLTHEKNNSVLIITNRKELLSQTNNKLNDFNIIPQILNSKTFLIPTASVVVAMVETLHRRLKKADYVDFIHRFNLIIIDECHISSFDKIFDILNEKQKVIGASATPLRKDPQPALEKFYDSIINVCQVQELIDLKYLSKPVSYGIPIDLKGVGTKMGDYDNEQLGKLYDDKIKYVGAISNYEMYAKNMKTIVFCATIKNSKTLTEEFFKKGYNCKHFDCYMSDEDRKTILEWFYNTDNAILCNVGILTTGFDCLDIKCVLLYRATKSLPLFLQMVGRGARVTETKKDFIVLDFGENIKQHGFWESDRTWTLKNAKKKKKTDVCGVKSCKGCGALIHISVNKCQFCGYEIEEKIKPKTEIEIILTKLSPSEINRLAYSKEFNIKELEEIRELKSYAIGWVLHKLKTYEEFLEYAKIKNYKTGWAKFNFDRYSKLF